MLVTDDLLGLSPDKPAKFVKQYSALHEDITKSVKAFMNEVREQKFPSDEYVY